MKRSDCLNAYQDFSAQTSDNVRKLSFAAIGIIWVFRHQDQSSDLILPQPLILSGVAVVFALLLDFLQYSYGTVAWGALHRAKEKAGVTAEQEFKAPRQINWPTNSLFWLKVAAVAAAYSILVFYLAGKLFAA